MLDKRDIAAMKLETISRRSTKKDFFDLYRLLQEFSFSDMLGWFGKKYQPETVFYILKSLTFFLPAESSFIPESLDQTTWEQVKQKMVDESLKFSF